MKAIYDHVASAGGEFGEGVVQRDEYFSHPCRDFAATDEAFRVRRAGDDWFVTYKGAKN